MILYQAIDVPANVRYIHYPVFHNINFFIYLVDLRLAETFLQKNEEASHQNNFKRIVGPVWLQRFGSG